MARATGDRNYRAIYHLLSNLRQLEPHEREMGNFDMGYNWTQSQDHLLAASGHPASGEITGLIANCLIAASRGCVDAYFDLGVAFSTGSHGAVCDLIEAHKWFNLAAVGGHDEAAHCRAEVSEEMTTRDIAEAQRRARAWIATTTRRAA